METSLRYDGEDRHLMLHAKEKFLLDRSILLQVHGKLDTHTGSIAGQAQLKKKFWPDLLTSLDVGAKFDSKLREITYDMQGKKTVSISDDGLLSIHLKTGYNYNPRFQLGQGRARVEMSYKIFNFTEDQDLRLKVGYNAVEQSPYFQVRENNWTLNAAGNGQWSIKYDL
ncbi:unnamed protein product [Calypogeia fissa]